MPNTPIKTAVIGYGFSAKTFHIPFVSALPEFELSAISTRNGDEVKNDWPAAQHFESADELLKNTDSELVIITAPNEVHFDLAKKALECGKHVVLEKPFVTNVADGEALIALAETKGLVLSVFHNRRWDGDFLTVKKMLDDNRLGELKHFESHFDRFRPNVRQRWREQAVIGGGILFDLGPHLIDQAISLFGIPDSVTAKCEIMREGSTNIDYFHLVLGYPNHTAILHADLFSAGPNRRFTIKGSDGSYEKLGLDPQEERLIAGIKPTSESWAEESREQYGQLYDAQGISVVKSEIGGYQHYFQQMAYAIRSHGDVPVSAEQALWNIKIIELAMESSLKGQTLTIPR